MQFTTHVEGRAAEKPGPRRQEWARDQKNDKLVAARLLLFASVGRWHDGDCLNIIAGCVSVAASTVLDLLLRHDPVDFCRNTDTTSSFSRRPSHNARLVNHKHPLYELFSNSNNHRRRLWV